MPQMAPLSWLTLMIYFILIYIIMLILNYYMQLYKNQNIKKKEPSNLKFNWKW